MKVEPIYIAYAIAVGIGATIILDLWALFLKRAFNIASANYCLVGRWLRYMPQGIFKHNSIAAAQKKDSECIVGWAAHYVIGATFALLLVTILSPKWLQQPTLLPALFFGISTVVMPLFVMHPSFGLGFASSKTSNPTQARLRSILTHIVFGLGLYLSAIALSSLSKLV